MKYAVRFFSDRYMARYGVEPKNNQSIFSGEDPAKQFEAGQ